MEQPYIIISVYGGLVQDVFSSVNDTNVILVDWDQDPDPPFVRDDIVFGKQCSALVGSFHARSLDDLTGTVDEAAIVAAQEKGVLDESPFVVS